jgi:hypothetical protein
MHRTRIKLVLVALLLAPLALSGAGRLAAQGEPQPYITANGIALQAGAPLPVYQFLKPAITQGLTSSVAGRFTAIASPTQGAPVFQDLYRGLPRYTAPNTATRTLLTQFAATGGFYAYNVDAVGADTAPATPLNAAEAQRAACLFLVNNSFAGRTGQLYLGDGDTFQGALTPDTGGCQDTGQYSATLIRGTGLNAAPGSQQDPVQSLGVVVQVPISLPAINNTPAIPLGGPGGHLSLLLRATSPNDTGATLDQGTPGLAAVALPFFERQFKFLREAPAVDIVQARLAAEQRLRALFPNATSISVPTPALIYAVGEAGEPQRALEPVLEFQGASATVGGQTIILKNFDLPAVQSGAGGFGPSVSIAAPGGTTFVPGALTALTGAIGAGTAPYSYTFTLEDGTPLGPAGSLAAPGAVSAQARLPAVGKDGLPAPVSVFLRVEDADGARREAVVTLTPKVAPQLYLPLSRKEGAAPAAAPAGAAPAAELAAVNYRFGSEMASDYPPYGVFNEGDLPGVPPDVNGLRNGLKAYGWGERFFWSNSGVWERDWRDCSLGGSDCTYGVDRADLAYYSGHGGPAGLYPSNNTKDSGFFDGANARFQNVRWAMFSSCQTLRVSFTTAPNEPLRRWLPAFRGAHMLLGFNSNMGDVAYGGPLVDNMRIPTFLGLVEFPWAQLSIRAAWVKTAFDLNAGKPAYVYATSASVNPADNKLPKGGDALLPRPTPVNWYYWVWWECADTNPDGGLCQN